MLRWRCPDAPNPDSGSGRSFAGSLDCVCSQFGESRPTPTPPTPAPAAPASTSRDGTFLPDRNPFPTDKHSSAQALEPVVQTHPWAAKAEHGQWYDLHQELFDRKSRALAEELATEIRTQFKAAAYLSEWGAEDRNKEVARQEQYREKIRKEYEPFLQLQKT